MMMIKVCNCLPTCTAITYDFEIAQAAMNWKQYINGVERGSNKHFDEYFINYMMVFIILILSFLF